MKKYSVLLCMTLTLAIVFGLNTFASAIQYTFTEKFFENKIDGQPDEWLMHQKSRVHIDFDMSIAGNKAYYQKYQNGSWNTIKSVLPTTDEFSFLKYETRLWDADVWAYFYSTDDTWEHIQIYAEYHRNGYKIFDEWKNLDNGPGENPGFSYHKDLDSWMNNGWLADGEFDLYIYLPDIVGRAKNDLFLKYAEMSIEGGSNPQVVPEPSAMILLGFGLAGLTAYNRKKMLKK